MGLGLQDRSWHHGHDYKNNAFRSVGSHSIERLPYAHDRVRNAVPAAKLDKVFDGRHSDLGRSNASQTGYQSEHSR